MILSFGDAATAARFHGLPHRKLRALPASILRPAIRKCDMLEAAHRLTDLASPPGNRLESLAGDLRGRYSSRVNERYRIVFRWSDLGAAEVRLLDYR